MRILHELSPTRLALEAILHQDNQMYVKELTMAIEDMRENRQTQNKVIFEGKRLHDIIFKHTGVFTQWHLDLGNKSENAAVMPTWIDTNNPLIVRWQRWEIGSKDGEAALAWAGQGAEGWVNLEEGKVGGIYSKLVNPAWLTEGALYGTLLTPIEVAAMIAHEVGHVVSLFGMIGQVDSTCVILVSAMRARLHLMPKEDRVKFFSKVHKTTGVDLSKNPDALNTTSSTTLQMVLTAEVNDQMRSEFGTPMYDMRTWEALSDQYAARFGFAVPLATALNKMYRRYDPMAYRSTITYLLVEIAKLAAAMLLAVAVAISSPLTAIVLLPVLLAINPHERTYDRPQERIARIRRDLVEQTKDRKMAKEKSAAVLRDIAVLDALLKEVKLRESFYEKIWTFFSAYTRDQNSAMRELQALEELMNNDMFVAAAELNALAN